MVAYNFIKQFAAMVEDGRKKQTIRAERKSRHARKGEPLQLYTGMRHSSCRKLIDPDPICAASVSIEISSEQMTVCAADDGHVAILKEKFVLDAFAKCDGFKDWEALVAWFKETHALPFKGRLIRWE